MQHLLKRAASYLPSRYQQELKRLHFGRQIQRGAFLTAEKEYALLSTWVKPGDWVLDIGANVGHYTARLSDLVGPAGRVIAFEPVPATFEILTANVARLPFQNVSLFNVAASNEAAQRNIEIPTGTAGLDNFYLASLDGAARKADAGAEMSEVPVLCLPVDAFNFPEKIRLAKIDTEGHEMAVLTGMRARLHSDRPVLIVEANDDDITPFLAALGYQPTRLDGSSNVVYQPV